MISSLETGTQSDLESASTRGASDSIACLFASVRCGTCKRRESVCGNRVHTSQFSRIKQRAPAIDLSGPKASAESLTPRRSSLAETEAVDFQFGLFSSAATLLIPAGVLSDLGLLPYINFFSRENGRRTLMVVLSQSRWCGFDRLCRRRRNRRQSVSIPSQFSLAVATLSSPVAFISPFRFRVVSFLRSSSPPYKF